MPGVVQLFLWLPAIAMMHGKVPVNGPFVLGICHIAVFGDLNGEG